MAKVWRIKVTCHDIIDATLSRLSGYIYSYTTSTFPRPATNSRDGQNDFAISLISDRAIEIEHCLNSEQNYNEIVKTNFKDGLNISNLLLFINI